MHTSSRFVSLRARAGFTLVEMMVSTALIVLIMLLFAQVYQVAADSVGRQKGIAENDQRSRTLTTIINNDFAARTFKYMLPIHPLEVFVPGPVGPVGGPTYDPDPSRRVGYFYISENEPLNDLDDVVQFTAEVGSDDPEFTGRALKFDQPPLAGVVLPANYEDPNQPEADDGQIDFTANPITNNRTGSSRFAEICYFVRNGNLIRRVLLIRRAYSELPAPGTPGDSQPPSFPVADYPVGFSFWNDFDYSAFYAPGLGPQFHDTGTGPTGELCNEDSSGLASLGRPAFRFGHDHNIAQVNPSGGNPREFVNQHLGTPSFIGRFTQQETSHVEFGYPGRIPDLDGDAAFDNPPFSQATNLSLFGGVISYQPGVDGNWGTSDDVQFGGPRRSEDILMSNVHAFDIKVLDSIYDETAANADLNRDGRINLAAEGGGFADLGHGATGDYSQANKRHTIAALPMRAYGPRTHAENNIFDTWHHQVDIDDADGDEVDSTGSDPPPFWPNFGGGTADPDPPAHTVVGRPLTAIQITIRFLDPASNQMRQLTLVESLVDTD